MTRIHKEVDFKSKTYYLRKQTTWFLIDQKLTQYSIPKMISLCNLDCSKMRPEPGIQSTPASNKYASCKLTVYWTKWFFFGGDNCFYCFLKILGGKNAIRGGVWILIRGGCPPSNRKPGKNVQRTKLRLLRVFHFVLNCMAFFASLLTLDCSSPCPSSFSKYEIFYFWNAESAVWLQSKGRGGGSISEILLMAVQQLNFLPIADAGSHFEAPRVATEPHLHFPRVEKRLQFQDPKADKWKTLNEQKL